MHGSQCDGSQPRWAGNRERGGAAAINHSGRDMGGHSGEACEAAVTRSWHLPVDRGTRLGLG